MVKQLARRSGFGKKLVAEQRLVPQQLLMKNQYTRIIRDHITPIRVCTVSM